MGRTTHTTAASSAQVQDAVRATSVDWQLFNITMEEAWDAGYISVEHSEACFSGCGRDMVGYEALGACCVDIQTEAVRQK